MAYSAPHAPFHKPPADLISSKTSTRRPADQYKAMIEAMDTEIGRLLDNLPDADKNNTYIVFIGDNGTPRKVRDATVFDKDHVKGTLYEGGIRAPLIVAGAGVSRQGEREPSLVNATDFFATFTALALGHQTRANVPSSSVSFHRILAGASESSAELRQYNYSEWRTRKTDISWTVRDDDYKVINHSTGEVELFATDDINEKNQVHEPEVQAKLLGIGEQIRAGEYYKK